MKLVYRKFNTKKKICVIDNIGGSYLPIAQFLTKYFDVYYHPVVQSPFPNMSTMYIGYGYDFKLLDNFWSNIDQFDLFIFCDIYFKDWGTALKKMGKLVVGGCESEDLEINKCCG